MAEMYEPRKVDDRSWRSWFIEGWKLSQRKLGLWLIYGVTLPVTGILLILTFIALFNLPLTSITVRLAFLTLLPFLAGCYICLGLLIAAHCDCRLSLKRLLSQLMHAAPVSYGLRFVFRRPTSWRYAYALSFFLIPFVFSLLPELRQPTLGSVPPPPLDSPGPPPAVSSEPEILLWISGALLFTGPLFGACTFFFALLLFTDRSISPHAFLHRTLLKLSWPAATFLVRKNLWKNATLLLILDIVPYALVCVCGTLLFYAFSAGKLPFILLLYLLFLYGVTLSCCTLYVAWRDMYLAQRENTPLPTSSQVAQPVASPTTSTLGCANQKV